MKRTYFFDLKDGIPIRDRLGLEFNSTGAAIEHSKTLAREISGSPARQDPDLFVSVINEAGAEIHREQVYPVQAISANKAG